jgi:mRNA-degrading endonuclease RelE of RelBE toxin-antitoxin system
MYQVKLKKKTIKNIEKMPEPVQDKMATLLINLKATGPIRTEWPNFSKLGKNLYHCHLTRKWVACWQHEEKSILIEVYYAGTRENAPY